MSRLGILMAILILSMPLSANAQINIRDGAADSDLISLMEMYEYSGDSSILDLILELADAGGFTEEKEQQARAYVQDKRNPVQPEESTPAPEEMPAQGLLLILSYRLIFLFLQIFFSCLLFSLLKIKLFFC